MKNIIITLNIVLAFIISSVSSNAQDNPYYKRSYIGSVELTAGGYIYNPINANLYTTHGIAYGNGLYTGIGTGYNIDQDSFPLYLEGRYSFIDNVVSPFVSARIGAMLGSSGLYASPAIGIDFGKWSALFRYEYNTLNYKNTVNPNPIEYLTAYFHALYLGVAFSF